MLKAFNEAMEIYSIDEAFMQLHDIVSFEDLFTLRQNIKRCTGIPISIGVGKTKTLAKVANQIAKMRVKENVFIFTEHTTHHLTTFPVEKIWGIGYRLAKKLQVLNIDTAQKLQDADPKMIRSHFSVSVEKTVQELNGTSCIGLEKHQPRKQIVSSRSFGKKVTELNDLEEAISHYATIAAKKLRQQKSVASALYVYLHTNLFKDQQPQYGNAIAFPFPCPTADTRYFIRIAKKCLRQIYKKGYQYHKAGIMLLDISQANIKQQDLLMNVSDEKSERVMQALDKINANFGKNTIYLAAEGIKRDWMIRCDKRSARYTTKWEELPKVIC